MYVLRAYTYFLRTFQLSLPNVVHIKINTGNDIIAAIYKFTDRCIVNVKQEESEARAEALAAEIALADCKECIKGYGSACEALNISIDEARAKSAEWAPTAWRIRSSSRKMKESWRRSRTRSLTTKKDFKK
jgi:hypothetical protein